MKTHIKIKNWSSFQSYKDRSPPWIRLHKKLLDNYKYQMMSAESRSFLPMLWLLAAEHDDPTSGVVDDTIEEISFRIRRDKDTVIKCIDEIEKGGFIEVNSDSYENVTDSLRNCHPETEAETEAETYIGQFEDFWDLYDNKVGKKKSKQKYKKALKETEHETIIKAVKEYNAYCKATGYNKKHPTTWLNGSEWDTDWKAVTESYKRSQGTNERRQNGRSAFVNAAHQIEREENMG